MLLTNHKLKFLIAILVMFAVGYVCSSNKDEKKEDKKEDTKKEDTKKEDTKKEDTKSDDTKKEQSSGSTDVKVYFCEEYRGGKEIGVSDEFIIGKNGGYFTCMIDMRGTGKTIGVGKLELRITKMGPSEKIVATEKFDVQPDWDYIYFDKFHTFYSAGDYKITVLKPDGTPVGTGEVKITMR